MARRSLAQSRVLITGASSGIGRELALAFARRGARLLLAARRESELNVVADQCRRQSSGAEAILCPGDLTDPGYRHALIRRAAEHWQGLDVLVNNAGVSAHGRFAISDETTLRQVMELNFFAAAELTRLAIPLLKRAGRPAIVNIGSIIGHRGLPLNSEYAASKFALRGWTESLRAELAADGIDVLLVSPGTTETEFFDHLVAKTAELPWGESTAIPAAAVAEQTVRALERSRHEIFPNWRGRALVVANRLFPGLVDRALAKLAAAGDKG
ncbi:SDR family NAD(P)-dependent oxidoreductase [Lacipirellula limnantheis]|uniref:General stress protein 39 n=1 Tax=Lacipirellula limnantheis TaxID=2528024 RepID=A0A517TWV1_9BACT|nr:SDR family NAD(P)-dependent oxidoreductase [Lacipirellula limnantheis]QDT72855.1 General stress protein 39 [Lacipirellula limnantheis]